MVFWALEQWREKWQATGYAAAKREFDKQLARVAAEQGIALSDLLRHRNRRDSHRLQTELTAVNPARKARQSADDYHTQRYRR